MRRDVWVLVWLWCIGYLLWPVRQARRFYLRRRLRRKMRALGMIPVVTILGTGVPSTGTAQTSDTVFTAPWITAQIGETQGGPAVYCIARGADFGSLVVIVSLTLVNVDTITPGVRPCPDPEHEGRSYPVFWDLPVCPAYAPPIGASPFVLVRCNRHWFRFPPRVPQTGKAI